MGPRLGSECSRTGSRQTRRARLPQRGRGSRRHSGEHPRRWSRRRQRADPSCGRGMFLPVEADQAYDPDEGLERVRHGDGHGSRNSARLYRVSCGWKVQSTSVGASPRRSPRTQRAYHSCRVLTAECAEPVTTGVGVHRNPWWSVGAMHALPLLCFDPWCPLWWRSFWQSGSVIFTSLRQGGGTGSRTIGARNRRSSRNRPQP